PRTPTSTNSVPSRADSRPNPRRDSLRSPRVLLAIALRLPPPPQRTPRERSQRAPRPPALERDLAPPQGARDRVARHLRVPPDLRGLDHPGRSLPHAPRALPRGERAPSRARREPPRALRPRGRRRPRGAHALRSRARRAARHPALRLQGLRLQVARRALPRPRTPRGGRRGRAASRLRTRPLPLLLRPEPAL